MAEINVKYEYPLDPNYSYETLLERIYLDLEREKYISRGKGFAITEMQSTLRKELKNPNGIFSTRFGMGLDDINPFADRYKCNCGMLKGRLYSGLTCPKCGTKVKYVDTDLDYYGWIVLKDPYYIIHPNLYKSIKDFFGWANNKKRQVNNKKQTKISSSTTELDSILSRILFPADHADKDGHMVHEEAPKDEPYFGIGMLEFKKHFDEIMKYYLNKNKSKSNKKADYYRDIMKDKDKVFTQSIPVYTIQLRPYKIDGTKFFFEGTNSIYNLMTKLAFAINNDNMRIFRKKRQKDELLFDLNNQYQDLYDELEKILSHKKGAIRGSLLGGRYSFTSRSVIVPGPRLEIDEVVMSYAAVCELMQQSIINVLQKMYNMTYNDAYLFWYKSTLEKNDIIVGIIKQFIAKFNGIPILINRNPSISLGSILYMRIVDICDAYVMKVPLGILGFLAGDFDGDVLNIMYIVNDDFRQACNKVLNPRNSMQISRNDGLMVSSVLPYKDILINTNTLANDSRQFQSKEESDKLKQIVAMNS